MTILKQFLALLIVCVLGGGAYYATRSDTPSASPDGSRGRQGSGGPVTITAEQARPADFPVYLDGVGSAKARNSIVVRPQVDGRLISIKFKEGQDVNKGDLLAKIDPVTYQAQLDQATAKKTIDEAQLANLQRDLARYEKVGTLAVTEKQIDLQRVLVVQQQAQIASDAAAIDNLKAILDYTDIKAPISGRVGIRNIDEGNLVRAGDATGIVTITEVRPISVMFTLPQQQLPVLTKALVNAALKVDAFTTDSRTLLDSGVLQVVDNQVDPQTGTIRIKADFPNDKLQLWPGQFVNVRLLVDTLKGAIVTPTASVQRGPNGPFVYVVTDGNTVSMRPVKISQQNEKDAVVAEGLKAGDSVVTSGFGRLEDGKAVKLSDARPPDPWATSSSPTSPPASSPPAAKSSTGSGQSSASDSLPPAPSIEAAVVKPADAAVEKAAAKPAPDTAADEASGKRQRKHKRQAERDGASAPP